MKTVSTATPDDSDAPKLVHKRGRTIQPIGQSSADDKPSSDSQASSQDELRDLADRAAQLAASVPGSEKPENKVLKIDHSSPLSEALSAFDENDELGKVTRSVQHIEPTANPAADLIRHKLNDMYDEEPEAISEAAEAYAAGKKRSKHQDYMYKLTTSGHSLAEIQTKWHNYYTGLPDDEKHEVWQEFYKNQHNMSAYVTHEQLQRKNGQTQAGRRGNTKHTQQEIIKDQIIEKVATKKKMTAGQHAKSLLFGIGLASLVGLVVAFVFYNPVFVAPFLSPSKSVSATPIIGNLDGPVGQEPKIIIPKINLEVPVVYGLGTIEENAIQDGLEEGVVHYAASPEPGQQGNSVIVGHSSNNILNSGKYKFAFVLLNRLVIGDTFFIHKDGVRYTYKIYESKIVPPTDVTVLGEAQKPNSITLITCDPPGTSINRLIIVAEQISPDPSGNEKATIDLEAVSAEVLPSDAPSLWSRIWPF